MVKQGSIGGKQDMIKSDTIIGLSAKGRQVLAPEPYAPRYFGQLGLWTVGRFRLKAYGINHQYQDSADIVPKEITEAARLHADRLQEAAEAQGQHFGLGYVVLHQGTAANWLLINWWIQGGIRCQLLSRAEHDAPIFFSPASGPLIECVWEALVTSHERAAWVRHIMNDVPDEGAYLSDWMQSGWF